VWQDLLVVRPSDQAESEALELLLEANAQGASTLPEELIVEVFRLGERYAHDPAPHRAVAELADAIERAAGEET
jgi:acetylornithine deacetylase/succinyl-diaminopimelate desuccinylase-like protein